MALAESASSLVDDYVACRSLGHSWEDGRGAKTVLSKQVWGRELVCSRCTTRRIELYDAFTAENLSRRYIYPPGYQYEGERFPRRMFTLALLQRARKQKGGSTLKSMFDRRANDDD